MSVESMAIALNHSRAKGAARIVLLGIANHDGDGGAWPSIATLARYAGVERRSVQRSLDQLVQLREIAVERQAGGTRSTADYMRPNLYHFTLRCPPSCDRSSRHRVRGSVVMQELPDPVTPASPPDAGVTPPRDVGVTGGVTPTSPEPSMNPHQKRSTVLETSTRGAVDKSHAHRFDPISGYCSCGVRA